MEKYPLLETTLLFYHNGNWKTPKDRLIVFLHYFMINYGFRIFIDKTTTAETLKLKYDDTLRIVYTKSQEVLCITHYIVDGFYKFDVKINNKQYNASFDLSMDLGLQSSSNSPIEIHNLDEFVKTTLRIIDDLNKYLEEKKNI
ncbi:unnamed protein product [Rotaria socialis]|uniref:Uncharacterized protein n=1 Tax=Rotaria socialis TaxID=392032 RepID=A0A821DLT8_9BILA|nr:unnamed protein product [Rotaria socialis]CAF3358459.1 unnamed protein product [Rotaria socialis]CAF3689664.1 unnamed protein product [Rotaria socialis]CAF4575775.1 unnamed protein product [Rotaria socialis]CAF4623822.1 unnamed protein product [Rotaria socialis]